jgi:uncharacterized protein (DUF1778 family)
MIVVDSKQYSASRRKKVSISLRIPVATSNLIDHAAELVGQTRTAFIVDGVHKHAVDVLIDRPHIVLDKKRHDALLKALDESPNSNAKLQLLMSKKSPWEM